MARFVVGIDLGTTHTVVASAPLDGRGDHVAIFGIPQLTTTSEVEACPLLPSCLYAPLPGEIAGAAHVDWVVGELARRRGVEVAGRFVASAKSWLSHAGVDRLAPILPWGTGAADEGDEAVPRISPVEASARVLSAVKNAWDAAHPDAPLADQELVLTVPASFDDVARELTLRAAAMAGLAPSLLEEPTAAFYDAVRDMHAGGLRDLLEAGAEGGAPRTVLVCDVGGGTTDLSLMVVERAIEGAPGGVSVRRAAVGRHILLGGDNMDLALALLAESRLAPASGRLDSVELAQLVASCREAKERIFAGDADEARVTVLGRGSKLVGGARSASLTRDDVERVVIEGFFPAVEDEAARPRAGIVGFGLPYEREPAITRHVRRFLLRHAAEMAGSAAPDAILLNGGVFRAEPIARALVEAVTSWASAGRAPRVVPNAEPELAVARGAVRFGLARRGFGVRVESGAARGYYVAVAKERAGGPLHAVCILPRGAKESVRHEALGRTFELVVGRSVRFELYASDVARSEAGDLVEIAPEEPESVHAREGETFERLAPVVARLPASAGEATVSVVLGGELLTTGQLELSAHETRPPRRRFRLEFQLREGARATSVPPPTSTAPPVAAQITPFAPGVRVPKVASAPPPASKLEEGRSIVDRVFGKKAESTPRETKDVVRDLERVLGERSGWTMDVARAIADKLLENPGARRRTLDHERAFWLLLGYCLRPGFGDPSDEARITRVWPLFEGRLAFPQETRGWQQFFIAWRRLSGGLTEPMQVAIREAMDPAIAPKEAGLKRPKRMPEALDELVQAVAALERVPAEQRARLGEWLVERTWVDEDPRLWTAIGRIGARVPLYASVHHVVPPRTVEAWLARLLRLKWESIPTAPYAAVQLARVTGDRARDVAERVRGDVGKKLAAAGARPEWQRAVRELVDVGEEERVAILGEGLPIGLRLVAPVE